MAHRRVQPGAATQRRLRIERGGRRRLGARRGGPPRATAQERSGRRFAEAERVRTQVLPEDVLAHKGPTKKFLCPLSANEYGIEFLSFVIQDYQSKKTIFEVSRDRPLPIDFSVHDAMDPDSLRKINYELSEDFLTLPNISTTLVFSVGAEPLSDFRMIERAERCGLGARRAAAVLRGRSLDARRAQPFARRASGGGRPRSLRLQLSPPPPLSLRPPPRGLGHYFRDRLIKSFDFSFGFCIPGSTNTWEAVYAMPPMETALVDDMVAHPSFFGRAEQLASSSLS